MGNASAHNASMHSKRMHSRYTQREHRSYKLFPQDLKCWFPHPNFVDKMHQSAAEAQKDHEYWIMACLLLTPLKWDRSPQILEKMDELKKMDELQSSSCI